MKGVARADGNPSADYEAVVLAFSRLSHAVAADVPPRGALATAAETAAVLLQADSSVVFLYDETTQSLAAAASFGIGFAEGASPIPGEGIARHCIIKGVPAIIPSLDLDRKKGSSALVKLGLVSALCVSLIASERRLGAIIVMSSTLRAFSAADIELLSAVADQTALAAWRTGSTEVRIQQPSTDPPSTEDQEHLIDIANRKIQELSIVNRVSEAVISTLDLSQLLDLALEQCLVAVEATVGSIMLLEEGSDHLVIRAARGLPESVVATAWAVVGEGISGWVAANGQPVLVQDARRDPRFRMNRYRDDITSAMSVPLKARGRVIGVLNASTTEVGRRYGPREIEFLTTVANQAAIAIDNAGLYDNLERRSEELSNLLKMSEAITSTLELREVLSLLSDRFAEMSHVDASCLLAFDADATRFRCLDGQGLSPTSKRSVYLDLSQAMAWKVLETGAPIAGDVTEGGAFASEVAAEAGLTSAVCVPLLASGRLVGAAALFSRQAKAFPDSEMQILAALGKLAGVAVHNALVYKHKYEIARALQFQLVPNVPLRADALEVGHKYSPAREVGGDYYDLIKVLPGKVGVVIADVAGNSVPAAMYTSMGKNVLLAYALDNDSPADVLRKLNRIACEQTQTEVFISLFYGIFDSATRIFRYACAGHEPALLCRPDGSFEPLHADGLLVGIASDVTFEEKEVVIDEGSILVMFTDGLVDTPAVRGKFGAKEIAEIVHAGRLKPAQELADNIYARLMEIAGSRVQDDVALVVLKSV